MFHEKLNNLCAEKSITITALLKELKLSTSLGTQWKNGSMPSAEVLSMFSDYFNVSIDYLLGKDDIKKRPTPEEVERFNEYLKNDDFRELMDLLANLPNDELTKIEEQAHRALLAVQSDTKRLSKQ